MCFKIVNVLFFIIIFLNYFENKLYSSENKVFKLCLKIETKKKIFSINEPITITFKIINCGKEIISIHHVIDSESFHYDDCFGMLKFGIISNKGKKLKHLYKENSQRLKLPSLENYFTLRQNFFMVKRLN